MKKIVLGVIIAAMVGWAFYDMAFSGKESAEVQDAEESAETGLMIGDLAPDFELVTMDGETVRLSDYRGERVFVNFWATWCPPCRAEMPDMQKLYAEQEVPVEILAVNLTKTEGNEGNVVDFIADYGLTFPILMDRESEVSDKYRVQAYPTSYLIDSKGRISFVAPGAMNHDIMIREVKNMD
ncbi:peroxiredoxin [Chryseomicrobium aureum]|uniref:redoxin domain-containing protein n=1 Tax=Chryseomicrobium aureum TaxID=1441723 RepID=UPI00195A55EB|nr:redoxin domain-containing protein [Chryseomicrobium aureum]MBM7707637.1 peroxiredoxin [Chryseomicrobium aureum]